MSYIWEEKNRGISLYEKAILEAEEAAAGKNDVAVQEENPFAEGDKAPTIDKVVQLIRTYPEQFRAKLALSIKHLEEGKWLDGSRQRREETAGRRPGQGGQGRECRRVTQYRPEYRERQD